MEPIVGRVGPFLIYGYTVALAGSIALGLALTQAVTRRVPQFAGLTGWVDGVLVALVGAMLGGRAAFVAAEWAYFAARPLLIWRISEGGFGYHGALLGGVIGLWLWTVARKRPFPAYINLLAPAFTLVNTGGWYGCWLHGCAYGRETRFTGQWWHDWLAADLPDPFGLFALRYQTQLLGVILGLVALIFTLYIIKRRCPQAAFWAALFGVSLGHLLVSLLRGDPAPNYAGARLDIWLNALFAILSVIQYWRTRGLQPPTAQGNSHANQ
jgi:phosphatidylglycerol---prolipoprotein diacylglyceryl transferase